MRHLAIPCLLAGLFIAGCELPEGFGDRGAKADLNGAMAQVTPTATPVPVPVEVEPVSRGSIKNFLTATTTLEAERRAQVLSKGNGIIRRLSVDVGDAVRKGGLLASLDTEELMLQKRKAELNVEQLQDNADKTGLLFEEKMVSQEVYDQALFELKNAKLELDTIELNLRNQRIIAPIGGVISERLANVGETVSVGTPVFTIVDLDSIFAKVYVPEREALALQPGQPVNLTTESFPGETFVGEVLRKAPTVDATSGTLEVRIGFEERDERLIPGMFLRANVIKDTRDGVIVAPKKAIIYSEDQPLAYVAAGKVAERRDLELGLEDNQLAEVVSGLEEGERLVVVGQRGLKDGAPLDIVGDEEEPAEEADTTAEGIADDTGDDEPTPDATPQNQADAAPAESAAS